MRCREQAVLESRQTLRAVAQSLLPVVKDMAACGGGEYVNIVIFSDDNGDYVCVNNDPDSKFYFSEYKHDDKPWIVAAERGFNG